MLGCQIEETPHTNTHTHTQGAGCSLMDRRTRFESIVRGMTSVADCPVTVKMRTGVHNRNWNAHKLIPKLRDWGVAMTTVSTPRDFVLLWQLNKKSVLLWQLSGQALIMCCYGNCKYLIGCFTMATVSGPRGLNKA